MRIQYKHQKFQADAAKAVVDVFAGQPYLTPSYMMDRGTGTFQIGMEEERVYTGWSNQKIISELSDQLILEHVQKIQRANQIQPSNKLEGRADGYNLTIEMETGVGKTYTSSRQCTSSTGLMAGASSSLSYPALQSVRAYISPLR